MDIINDNDNKTDIKQTSHHKGKSIKVKKVEGKKPIPGVASFDKAPDTRSRAKSTLANPFDSKKPMNSKKESKPVETIGSDRFNLLKSMFEKKGPPATAEIITRKYEPKNFSVIQQKENIQTTEERKSDTVFVQPAGISDGIKKRMQDLMNSNKRSSAQTKIDPILEQRKKEREIKENDDDDDQDEEDEEEENLGISEEEDNVEKDDEFSESDEEKQKEEVKIEEKNKEINDSIVDKDDSIEEQKEENNEEVLKEEKEIETKEDNITEEKQEIKSYNEQNAASENIEKERIEEIKHTLVENKNDDTQNFQQEEIHHETLDFVKIKNIEEKLNSNPNKKESEYEEQF